ncbi:heterokaryon incompatibility protein-domain-containing protein [Trametes polyzona]|nr:heterokaryon incompatibility protein-domain-containing protein [Trametes polyzona]
MSSRRARKYRRRTQKKRRSRGSVAHPHSLPQRPPSLCRSCWRGPFASSLGIDGPVSYDSDRMTHTGGYAYSVTLSVLEFRANSGCVWCRFIFDLHASRDEDRRNSHRRKGHPARLHVRIGGDQYVIPTPKGAQPLFVYLDDVLCLYSGLYTAADDPAAKYIRARPRILDVGSPHALASAKTCLEECVRKHEQCRGVSASVDLAPLPTRLLDCSDPERPRLVVTSGLRGVYVTLSYVWGEAQPHRTVISNLSTYIHGIDPLQLPQTIRDAIHVTHALGLQYLWTDSLCIIQDSQEDKNRELARMRHIYRYAYVTIIAGSASKVSEGFLQVRRPVTFSCHCRQQTSNTALDTTPLAGSNLTFPFLCPTAEGAPTREVGTVSLIPLDAHEMCTVSGLDTGWLEDPITTRAWCMQEWLLSPRSLNFASHTLQYKCQTTTLNVGDAYCDMSFDAVSRLPPSVLFEQLEAESNQAVEHGTAEWERLHRSWWLVVEDYTPRSISFPSDKLVACAGVAEDFQRALGSDYLAGLWRDTILPDLLWFIYYPGPIPRGQSPLAYRAPSWSWAARDGGVNWNSRGTYIPFAEVLQCGTTLLDATLPFGQVTGGYLVLRAPLIPCAWGPAEDGGRRILLKPANEATGGGDTTSRPSTEHPRLTYVGEDTTGLYVDTDIDCLDDEGAKGIRAILVLQDQMKVMVGLIVTPNVPEDPNSGSTTFGAGSKAYRRVGRFSTGPTTMKTLGWDELRLTSALQEIELV